MTPVRWSAALGTNSGRARIIRALGIAAAGYLLLRGARLGFYDNQLLTIALLYAIVAVSMDLAWGYTGILSMGQAVFFGLGDYGVALLSVNVTESGVVASVTTRWWTYPAGMMLGVGAALFLAFLVGKFAFSGRSSTPFYVAVVTLALTVMMYTIFLQSNDLGGQNGLQGFAIRGIGPVGWYWIVVTVFAVITTLAYVVVRSDVGLLLKAIRDNEQRCHYLGYNVERTKLAVFMISAAVAAVAGALYGGYIGFVSPPLVGFLFATEIIIWVAVGGRGTLVGPILGAVLINLIGPRLSESLPYVWTVFLGGLFILVVTFIPDGVFPALTRLLASARGLIGRRTTVEGALDAREIVRVEPRLGASTRSNGDPVAMSIEDLHRSFDSLEVLRGVSLVIYQGELLSIVGPNGAGKSTLLGVLSDGTVPHKGDVRLHRDGRRSIRGLVPREIARAGVARKFQTPNLFESLTPIESLLLAARKGRTPSIWRRSKRVGVSAEVHTILKATGLIESSNARSRDLSHGQKQALELAMTVSLDPQILLLDEPTAGLTAEERRLIGDLLEQLVRDLGITLVLIEHDFDFVRRIADRIAVLHDGVVLLSGDVQEVAESDLVKQVYLGVPT